MKYFINLFIVFFTLANSCYADVKFVIGKPLLFKETKGNLYQLVNVHKTIKGEPEKSSTLFRGMVYNSENELVDFVIIVNEFIDNISNYTTDSTINKFRSIPSFIPDGVKIGLIFNTIDGETEQFIVTNGKFLVTDLPVKGNIPILNTHQVVSAPNKLATTDIVSNINHRSQPPASFSIADLVHY